MNLETLSLSQLKPAEYNPREISKEEFAGLIESLKTFGQVENLVVNKDMTVVSGHMRLKAMQELGIKEATCNVVDVDKHTEKKLNVLLNSQAISGKYDDLKLSEILEELKLDDDYESLRLDKLEPLDLSDVEVEEDEAPEVSSEPPVSKLGEVYQLGRHRVMCGDSTKDVGSLCDVKTDVCITDPPYGVRKELWDDLDNFIESLSKWQSQIRDNTKNGYIWFCADKLVPIIVQEMGDFERLLVWNKPAGSQFAGASNNNLWYSNEPILVYDFGELKKNFDENTEYGYSVFESRTEPKAKEGHPTTKPIDLMGWLILHYSKKGQTVLDPFLGSGSTLIACEQTDRICYGMELDPKYVDVIRKRYWKFTHDGNEEGWEDGTTN